MADFEQASVHILVRKLRADCVESTRPELMVQRRLSTRKSDSLWAPTGAIHLRGSWDWR